MAKECPIIAYYASEKKNAKINWSEFGNICRRHGYTLSKLDLNRPLQDQGPFFAIIHKMTDVIVKANLGDIESSKALNNVESYLSLHPETIVIDPLAGVRALMDRSRYYRIVQNSDLAQDKVFTPTFVDLTSGDVKENIQRLKEAGVTYPFVCKPSVAHGSDAHQMAIIFNKEGVVDCRPPCVAQSFINHNAILYKIFIVGDQFHVSERPSLKNFHSSDQQTIFFTTSDVSKADATSSLTVLDAEDAAVAPPSNPDALRLQHIVSTLRRELGMVLIGVDVVIEHGTGRYGIIDINIFPGYDSFPNFFDTLMKSILALSSKDCKRVRHLKKLSQDKGVSEPTRMSDRIRIRNPSNGFVTEDRTRCLQETNSSQQITSASVICDQDDSGFDTGDSSDERKKKWCMARARSGQSKKQGAVRGAAVPSYGNLKPCTSSVKDEGLG